MTGSDTGEKLSLHDWIKEFYINLLEDKWKLEEIEEIDIIWYFDLINYTEDKEYRKQVAAMDDAGL